MIFVLLFRYVFGGAVQSLPGVPYVDYLMPGIFVQTTVFGAIGTAIGLATDLKSGLLERFRSLPMARSAVMAGRTLAALIRERRGEAAAVLPPGGPADPARTHAPGGPDAAPRVGSGGAPETKWVKPVNLVERKFRGDPEINPPGAGGTTNAPPRPPHGRFGPPRGGARARAPGPPHGRGRTDARRLARRAAGRSALPGSAVHH